MTLRRSKVHLELLLSKKVLDQCGRPIGRIEDVHAESIGDDLVVKEYLVGPHALIERFAITIKVHSILKKLGLLRPIQRYKIPWDNLDLTNPDSPRLIGDVSKLTKIRI